MRKSFATLAVLYLIAAPAYAHRDGCHRWHSCPSDRGTYECGDLGYTTYCGTDTAQASVYVPATPQAEENPIRYTKTKVNLRATPSVKGNRTAVLDTGVPVTVHGCGSGWCKVTVYNGYKGYVSQQYLRR